MPTSETEPASYPADDHSASAQIFKLSKGRKKRARLATKKAQVGTNAAQINSTTVSLESTVKMEGEKMLKVAKLDGDEKTRIHEIK